MTRNHVGCTIRAGLLALAVGVSETLSAMPTQQELAKADPLIQELMGDDLSALRTGKKTREQVGDTAAALAKQAQSPAEKYLLFTGAFDQYMRGGNYEKAHSALSALRESIPDWKSSDEFTLIEKALRSVAFGKGGPVRGRYEALKERQQYALRLKKALSQVQAKPTDKKLQFHVAAYSAALGDWPAALDAFIAGSNPACADAAKLEKESAPPANIADAWWSVVDIRPAFLSSAIRAHAVALYTKALSDPTFAGLQKAAAEKRVQEVEAAIEASSSKSEGSSYSSIPSAGSAKFTGVKLVGTTVKNKDGILSDFSRGSYALIESVFSPDNAPIEAEIEFTMPAAGGESGGLFGGFGSGNGFSPFYISGSSVRGYLSTSGKTWDIASSFSIGLLVQPKETYRLMCSWDGILLKKLHSTLPVAGGLHQQRGTDRGAVAPFMGTIDLNKCYIKIGGKL